MTDAQGARGAHGAPVHAGDCLTALGDPTRRTIFERVARGPQSVGQLALGMPVSRPAVSQHLRVLSDAGLVVGVPDGNRRVYRLDLRGVKALRDYLDGFWPRALIAFQAEVERPSRPTSSATPGIPPSTTANTTPHTTQGAP